MRRLRALVADDDAELLEVVCGAIERWGADVTCAVSGFELLEKLANSGPFDFIVTDVSMPWMTGLQVLHSSQTAGTNIPVIVMTALRDQKTFDQAHALGEHATLLLKPFTLPQLLEALRGCVKQIGQAKTQPLARTHA